MAATQGNPIASSWYLAVAQWSALSASSWYLTAKQWSALFAFASYLAAIQGSDLFASSWYLAATQWPTRLCFQLVPSRHSATNPFLLSAST